MNAGLATVLRLAEYRKYLVGALLAAIGSGMYFIAISWYLFKTSGSTMAIGWAFIATTLPGLLLSPVVGVLVDRWNSKRVCAVADLLRGLTLLAMGWAMARGALKPVHVYAATAFLALCDNFFQPAIGALVRDLVSKENLLPANVASSMGIQIGTLLGASLGGFAVAGFGTQAVVGLNAASFLASAVLLATVRHARRVPAPQAAAGRPRILAQFRQALDETPERGLLLVIALQQLIAYLTVFVCNTLLPGFVSRELHAGAQGFGLIDAAWGVGAMCGGLLLGVLLKRAAAVNVGTGCVLAFGVGLLALGASQGVQQAAAAYLVLGCLGVMLRINADTEIARRVDPAHFGKIKSGVLMLVSWSSLLVYAVIGRLGDTVQNRWLYAAVGVVALGCGALMRSRLRRPAPPAASLQPLQSL